MSTMSAAERRSRARDDFNGELQRCPGHEVLAILSEKWTTLVLEALEGGALRHAQLSRVLAGASQKMLTQTLRRLERDGLVSRTVIVGVPVRVDYELTGLGRELLDVQAALLEFGVARMSDIRAARDRYDRYKATAE